MNVSLGNGWIKRLEKRIEGFDMEVGILEDKPRREPIEAGLHQTPNLGSYAGGPVRKLAGVSSKTNAEVFIENQERLGIDLLREPFKDPTTELQRFTTAFLQSAIGKSNLKRVENLLQAIVRNPILELKYGNNKPTTADNKGFDRNLIDTAQMFKAIKAKVTRV